MTWLPTVIAVAPEGVKSCCSSAHSIGIDFVTDLMPLVIPEQPKGEWFDALVDTPVVATPLETLEWLRTPDSPSLGKRTYNSDTGPASLIYGPAEYNAITGPDRLTTGLTEPSGLNGQDDPED